MKLTERIQGIVTLTRLPYILMLDLLCVLFIVTFQKGLYDLHLIGLAVLAVSLITAGGAAINDCFDRDSDALSHPERPIPSQRISPAGAARFSALLFLVGLGISFAINAVAFGIVAVNVVLFVTYPRVVKRFSGFVSNLVMGYLGATIALFSGAVVFHAITVDSLSFVGLIAGAAIGLNVLKDILTLKGDSSIGYPTLAGTRGVHVAAVAGALFLLFSVFTSPLPFVVGVVSVAYLFPILVWGAVVGITTVPILRAPNSENVRRRLRTFTVCFPYAVALAGVAYILPFAIWGA
jgi:geranylgeranylglycerol-phosphate geranylgeranyltransferase